MKTLYLIRHAKSDWGNDSLKDIDRHLSTRGYSDAYLLSKQLAEKPEKPELIISSPAIRAFSTAQIFSRAWNIKPEAIQLNSELYEATTDNILKQLKKIDDRNHCVAVFGHNPGFTSLFNELTEQYLDNLPTCGIVCVEFKIDSWKKIIPKSGTNKLTLFPKEFKQ